MSVPLTPDTTMLQVKYMGTRLADDTQEWYIRNVEHHGRTIREWMLESLLQAMQKQFLHMLMHRQASVTRFQRTANINSRLPDASFLQLTKEISKSQASVLFQLRSKHIPLRKYLFRISKTDSPVCALCQHGDETVHHFCSTAPHTIMPGLTWGVPWVATPNHYIIY